MTKLLRVRFHRLDPDDRLRCDRCSARAILDAVPERSVLGLRVIRLCAHCARSLFAECRVSTA